MAGNDLIAKANPQLNVKEFQDLYLRKNFENLVDYFKNQNQLLNFRFLELNFTKAVKNQKVSHGLGVIPLDAIPTRISGSGTFQINWGLCDSQNLDVTATGACRVRLFIGSYWNFISQVNNNVDDLQQLKAEAEESAGGTLSVVTTPIAVNYTATAADANKLLVFNAFLRALTVKLPPAAEALGKGIFILQKVDQSFNPIEVQVASPTEAFDNANTVLNLSTYKDTLQVVSNGSYYIVLNRTYSGATFDVGYNSSHLTTNGLVDPVTLVGGGITQLNGVWRRKANWIEIIFSFNNGTGAGPATGNPGPLSIALPGVTAANPPVRGPLQWDLAAQPIDTGAIKRWNGNIQVYTSVFKGNENARLINDFFFFVQNSGTGLDYDVTDIGEASGMNGVVTFPVLGWGA